MNKIKLVLSGILVGIANIVPGLSGGTILVLLGIYDETIEECHNITIKEKRFNSIIYLFLLIFGILLGIISTATIINKLLEFNYMITLLIFALLVVVSIPKFLSDNIKSISNFKIYPFLISFIGLLTLIIMAYDNGASANLAAIPNFEITLALFLLISGLISGFAMIFPGISGSMILLLIGSYKYITAFVSADNITSLNIDIYAFIGFIGIGILFGIILSVILSRYLLKQYRYETLSIIFALIAASTFGLIYDAINHI